MATATEQLAGSFSPGIFQRATELKARLWFTGGALLVYRLGTFVPVPGVDGPVVADMIHARGGEYARMLDMCSGGGLSRMAVFALSVVPYVTACTIMGLASLASPSVSALTGEAEAGRRRFHHYMRYLTVLVALVLSYGVAVGLEGVRSPLGPAVPDPGWAFRAVCVLSLTGGAMFLTWLAEQITARGVGNGVGLVVAIGIVANLPATIVSLLDLVRTGDVSGFAILAVMIVAAALLAVIVYVERAQRRVTVQYLKRQVGNKMFGGDSTQMPLKLNVAGAIPAIFALALLTLPALLAAFIGPGLFRAVVVQFTPGGPGFIVLLVVLLVAFSFLYMRDGFDSEETADNLKKHNGSVPGVRAGTTTVAYFDRILTRLTGAGAVYLVAICVLPELLISGPGLPFFLGGTSILIVALVTMDTVTQVQTHLLAKQYEGQLSKTKVKGRR